MDIRHLQWLMGKLRLQWRNLMAGQQEQCALLGKVVPLAQRLSAAQACPASSSGWGWPLAVCWSSQAWLGTDWLGVAQRWDATAPDCPGGALSRCCWASVGQGIREASGGKAPCPPTISWV